MNRLVYHLNGANLDQTRFGGSVRVWYSNSEGLTVTAQRPGTAAPAGSPSCSPHAQCQTGVVSFHISCPARAWPTTRPSTRRTRPQRPWTMATTLATVMVSRVRTRSYKLAPQQGSLAPCQQSPRLKPRDRNALRAAGHQHHTLASTLSRPSSHAPRSAWTTSNERTLSCELSSCKLNLRMRGLLQRPHP